MYDLEYPHITAATPSGQTEQITSFLWQTIEKLNYILGVDASTIQLKRGSATFNTHIVSGESDLKITFDSPFPKGTKPTVVCSLAESSSQNITKCSLWVLKDTVTATDFTVRVINDSATEVTPTINYIALV